MLGGPQCPERYIRTCIRCRRDDAHLHHSDGVIPATRHQNRTKDCQNRIDGEMAEGGIFSCRRKDTLQPESYGTVQQAETSSTKYLLSGGTDCS